MDIDSCDGKAWIGLKLQLGSATQQHLNVGSSFTYKDRRKMKSNASRKTVSNVNYGSTAKTDTVVYDLPAEEADVKDEKPATEMKVDTEKNSVHIEEPLVDLSIDTENSAEINSDVENTVKDEYASASESPGSSKNVNYHENTASADEIVYINATAVLDNSNVWSS